MRITQNPANGDHEVTTDHGCASGDTLFNAVEKLGLKLESRKAPIEMLVIDQALKTPTDN